MIVNRINISTLVLGMLALSSGGVNAADASAQPGPYVGASLGRGSFNARDPGLPKVASDETSLAGKVYGGYRLSDRLGVEAGYARLGSVHETLSVGGTAVEQGASGRSLYVAATGRLPIAQDLALTGKAGLSFGKVTGTNLLPASADITGSRRSFMYGIGAEYQLSSRVALTADFDHFGKLSQKVSANMLSAGVRYSF
jgi:OOP family OmpA-OmpF porin